MTYDPTQDGMEHEDMPQPRPQPPVPSSTSPMDEGDGLPPEMWLQRLAGETEQLMREAQERHSMYQQREEAIKNELTQVRQHKARTEGEIEMLFHMRSVNQEQLKFLAKRES